MVSLAARHSFLQPSYKNGKLGAILGDGEYMRHGTDSSQKQPHTPGYQPQDDNELYRHQSHQRNLDDNPPNIDDTELRQSDRFEKFGVTGIHQTPKKRRVQKVHFESLTNLKGANSNSSASSYSSGDAGE